MRGFWLSVVLKIGGSGVYCVQDLRLRFSEHLGDPYLGSVVAPASTAFVPSFRQPGVGSRV